MIPWSSRTLRDVNTPPFELTPSFVISVAALKTSADKSTFFPLRSDDFNEVTWRSRSLLYKKNKKETKKRKEK